MIPYQNKVILSLSKDPCLFPASTDCVSTDLSTSLRFGRDDNPFLRVVYRARLGRSVSFIVLCLFLSIFVIPARADNNADYIDPRIGTEGAGGTLIGPSLPFGMIKPGPDTGSNDQNSGWSHSGDINGFSQTHVSGTGGGCKYGNILIQPTVGPIDVANLSSPRENETANLCYYSVNLKRYNVKAEITTAARAALYRFTFPATDQAHIIFDAAHCLSSDLNLGEGQQLSASSIQILSPREIAGSSSVTSGWNKQSNSYTVYFYAMLDTPASSSQTGEIPAVEKIKSGDVNSTGAWLTFTTTAGQAIQLKIGISFVSIDQARANTKEITGFDFEKTRTAAIDIWNKALSPIQITGGTLPQKKLFYTCVYHAMLMPVDRTGENPLWKSSEPYYDDFYTIWDTFRSSSPLLTLIAQSRQTDIVRALIDIEKHDGFLPDGRSGNFNGRSQGGSNADTLIADAYVKKLPGINWDDAYAAVVKDAEVPPVDQFKEGRGGLEDWHTLGYCSMEGVDRSPGKSMEYAYNDFGIGLMAKGLGKKNDAATYFKRAGQWQNLWDANFSEGGFSGFIRSRHRNGDWKKDFTAMQGCSWNGDTFYEGNSWTYSFFVPQDVATLISKCGGNAIFVNRLDAFFNVPGRCDVADEPFFLTPYLYIWAGRQDKTAERVNYILTHNYSARPGGLPGNDDSGAMGSWYAFGAMGFFPNAGQDIYLIGTPMFPEIQLALANGKTFTIHADNLTDKNIYVTSATLNGQPLNSAWIRQADIINGGTLQLQMGSQPNTWPSGPPPPSPLSDSLKPY